MRALTTESTPAIRGNELSVRFAAPLYSYFMRRVRDRAQAEDLAQEVLLRVVEAGRNREIEHPESYVFTVAANLLKDLRRRADRQPQHVTVPPEADSGDTSNEPLVDERSPERVLIGELALEQVLRALSELGEMTRNVFILFRLENMRQKDIATLFGIGQSTVEKHVMRATVHLARRCAES